MAVAANVTDQDLNIVKAFIADGQISDAWRYLHVLGDTYADEASQAASHDPNNPWSVMVQSHWENTVGTQLTSETFDAVAKQHIEQYVQQIKDTGNWPDTQFIEQSDRKSLDDHQVSATAAIDGMWDALGKNWAEALGMEPGRIVPSDVFADMDPQHGRLG